MKQRTILWTLIALALVAPFIALGLAMPAEAATCTWTSGNPDALQKTNWDSTTNWSGCSGNFPGSLDSATVPNGLSYYPRLTANKSVAALNIGSTARITLAKGVELTVSGNSAVDGTIGFEDSTALLRVLANAPAGVTVTFANSPTISGTLELTSSGGAYTPTLTVSSGNLNIAAKGTLNVLPGTGGTAVINAPIVNAGTVSVTAPLQINKKGATHTNSGTFQVAANVAGDADEFVNNSNLNFVQPDAGVGGLAFSACSLVRNNAGGNVRVNAGAGVTTTITAQLVNAGTVNISSTLTLDKPATTHTNTGTFLVNADVTGNGSVFDNSGNLVFGSAGGAVMPTRRPDAIGGLAFSACGLVRNNAGGNVRVNAGAGVTTTMSAAIDNGGTLDVKSPLFLNKPTTAYTNTGNINLNGGNVTIEGGAAVSQWPAFFHDGKGALNIGAGNTFKMTGGAFTHDGGALAGAGTMDLANANLALNANLTNNVANLKLTNVTANGAGHTLTNSASKTLQAISATIGSNVDNAGTFVVAATNTLNGNVTTQPNSTIRLGDDGVNDTTLNVNGAAGLANYGTIDFPSGGILAAPSQAKSPTKGPIFRTLMVQRAPLTNTVNAVINVNAGAGVTSTLAAQLVNAGTVNISSTLTLDKPAATHTNTGTFLVNADVTGNGNVFDNSGNLVFGSNSGLAMPTRQPDAGMGALAFGACALVRNNASGTVRVNAGAGVTTTVSAPLDNQGGTVTVNSPLVLNTTGGLAPSRAPRVASTNSGNIYLTGGNFDITGDYTQSPSGTLWTNIGGATQYYHLTASGTASLDGPLNLAWVNGFVPSAGNSFTIVNAGTRTGTFATINGLTVGGKTMQTQYGATFMRIFAPNQLFLPLIVR